MKRYNRKFLFLQLPGVGEAEKHFCAAKTFEAGGSSGDKGIIQLPTVVYTLPMRSPS
jgi:hypothetical protein